jgi:hypothetical protein
VYLSSMFAADDSAAKKVETRPIAETVRLRKHIAEHPTFKYKE